MERHSVSQRKMSLKYYKKEQAGEDMEETYTQAIDVRQYKRSGTHLNLLVVSKKEGLSEIPLEEFRKDKFCRKGCFKMRHCFRF